MTVDLYFTVNFYTVHNTVLQWYQLTHRSNFSLVIVQSPLVSPVFPVVVACIQLRISKLLDLMCGRQRVSGTMELVQIELTT